MAPIAERNRIRSLSGLGPSALRDDRTHRFRFSKRRASFTRKGVGGVPAASSSVPSGARLGSSAGFLSPVRPLSMSAFSCALALLLNTQINHTYPGEHIAEHDLERAH